MPPNKKSAKKPKKVQKQTLGAIQSDFISLTSHQLRTPLSGTKWLLELLQKGSAGTLNKKQKEYIEKIYHENERMIALVNDLLEVTRLESGESKLYLRPTDVAAVVRNILREKEDIIKKKRMHVTFSVEHEPFPYARTEPTKIKQAISNIITNAITYTPENGKINIDLRLDGDLVLGKVSDSGVGIPDADQKLVFEKFFRSGNVLRMETTGTGLGLYITKAFIEASGGKIWFKSKVGEGTTFYFTLPLAN